MALSDQLRDLNPQQLEAVRHFQGPLLVLAGAGSGKTRVLTVRAAFLVEEHGVPPERILCLTFTNRAAGEMRERVRSLLGGRPEGLWAGTFHSFGAWLLRRHAHRVGSSRRFTIRDADESLELVERSMDRLGVDPDRHPPAAVRREIEDAKHYLVTPDAYEVMLGPDPDPHQEACRRVYGAYQEALERQDALDFGDLLLKSVELLRDHPEVRDRYRDRFAFLLVDEYQDTNHAQFRVVQILGGEHCNVMAVGDDDQSIYGWRGADLRNILEFDSDFGGCRTVRLEKNYRSTGHVLAAANAVIENNEQRREKTLFTDRGRGEKVRVVKAGSDAAEARWIAGRIERMVDRGGSSGGDADPGDGAAGAGDAEANTGAGASYRDFAILYRTNAQSRALEDAVRRRGIPYQIVGGLRFYERREVRDLLAYLRLVANPADRSAFERAVNRPRRGIGEVTRSRLFGWARKLDLTPLEAARRATDNDDLPARGARSLERFAALVDRCRAAADDLPAADLLRRLVAELEFLEVLKEEGPEGEQRAENVEELVAAAAEVDESGEPPPGSPAAAPEGTDLTSLDRFLQEVSLVTDVDRRDPDADAVLLMTLHSSKGLEFPHVFLAGMEEGLCPHSRSVGSAGDMEEERRLFYVGLTRARETACLTHAETRRRFGRKSYSTPSRFLDELPSGHVEEERAGSAPGGLADGLTAGDRVEHPRFGPGEVVERTDDDRDPRIVVDFEDEGRKRLSARYANLSPAD